MRPIVLGGNTFGWTSDASESFAVLDRFAAGGFAMIDTADQYSSWIPGNSGGESELIVGSWLSSSGRRDDVVLATKVGKMPGSRGLSPQNIAASIDASLRRLQVDHVDLYYAHIDDDTVPLADSLGALDAVVRAGKARYVALSNFTAGRLRAACETARSAGYADVVGVQTQYNALDRREYEGPLADAVGALGLASFPYLGLANGYLSGKYAADAPVSSARSSSAAAYDDTRGRAVLAVLRAVADRHGVAVASAALAWVRHQPTVTAPIASARTPRQVDALVTAGALHLSDDELSAIDHAGAVTAEAI